MTIKKRKRAKENEIEIDKGVKFEATRQSLHSLATKLTLLKRYRREQQKGSRFNAINHKKDILVMGGFLRL